MSDEKQKGSAVGVDAGDQPVNKIKFDYIKSNHFRVVHADGALVIPPPNGEGVRLFFLSERYSLPQSVAYEQYSGGNMKELVGERQDRNAIIREVEVQVSMNLNVARGLHEWLGKLLEDNTNNSDVKGE